MMIRIVYKTTALQVACLCGTEYQASGWLAFKAA